MDDLKLGDQIIKMDEVRYDKLSPEQWCEMIENSPIKKKNEVRITIIRDNKELNFTLKKIKLI
jgi:C-terminal processing protease CtpA/Prc